MDGLLLEYLPNESIESYLRINAPYTTMVQRLRWGQQAPDIFRGYIDKAVHL